MLTESMEWTCNYCGGVGEVEYPTERIEESILIVCAHCSKPSAYVWCDNCGMDGQITETVFTNSPKIWQCMKCGAEYELPEDFYTIQINFVPQDFVNVEKLKEQRDIELQRYITVYWIKNALKFWGENRIYVVYVFIGSFIIGLIGTIIKDKYLNYDFLFYPMIFSFILFFILFGIDLILWLVSKMFLAIYKLRKFRK